MCSVKPHFTYFLLTYQVAILNFKCDEVGSEHDTVVMLYARVCLPSSLLTSR